MKEEEGINSCLIFKQNLSRHLLAEVKGWTLCYCILCVLPTQQTKIESYFWRSTKLSCNLGQRIHPTPRGFKVSFQRHYFKDPYLRSSKIWTKYAKSLPADIKCKKIAKRFHCGKKCWKNTKERETLMHTHFRWTFCSADLTF